jgi:hypothetical protein
MVVEDRSLLDGETEETEETPRMNPLRFKAAEESLAWVFGSSASAIGFAAQNIAGGGGGLVWDAARIAALHMKMRSPARMRAAAEIRRLEWATAEMTREDFEVAHLAFTPRGLSPKMRYAFKKGDGHRCLAAVGAAKCPYAAELRDRKKRTGESVFEFLQWECASLNEDGKGIPPRLLRIRDWADDLVDEVVERFVPILDERDAFDYKVRVAKKEQLEKRNVEIAASLQPKRPETVEERMRAIDDFVEQRRRADEIAERMMNGGGRR